MRNWPTGSARRDRGALESGTNSAVSEMAARPTGMFAQKMPRQPTVPTSTPPSTGPSAMDRPNTPSHTPMARARSARPVNVFVMMPSAAGLSIEPPTPCRIRKPISQPRLGARLHIHGAEGEQREADLEDGPAPDPVGDRAGEHQQRGQHDRVGGDRPLQAGDAGVQVPADGRQPHVHDRVVQAHHEQAHAADGEHEGAAPAGGDGMLGAGRGAQAGGRAGAWADGPDLGRCLVLGRCPGG